MASLRFLPIPCCQANLGHDTLTQQQQQTSSPTDRPRVEPISQGVRTLQASPRSWPSTGGSPGRPGSARPEGPRTPSRRCRAREEEAHPKLSPPSCTRFSKMRSTTPAPRSDGALKVSTETRHAGREEKDGEAEKESLPFSNAWCRFCVASPSS